MRYHIHPPARQLIKEARAGTKLEFGEISAALYVLFSNIESLAIQGSVVVFLQYRRTNQISLSEPLTPFKQVPEPRG